MRHIAKTPNRARKEASIELDAYSNASLQTRFGGEVAFLRHPSVRRRQVCNWSL